jgi:predicted MFS family arabinose efflux permease
MFGAEVAVRILTLTSARPRLLSCLTICTGLALVGAGFLAGRPNPALVLLFLMNAFQGAREPLALAWFNEEVPAEARATLLSFRGMVATAGGALGLLLGGYITDLGGIPFAWKVAGALCLLAVPCYLALRRRSNFTLAV